MSQPRLHAPRTLPRVLVTVIRPIQAFIQTSAASGIILILSTFAALLWANSRFSASYHRLFSTHVSFALGTFSGQLPVRDVINDLLMAIFFLVVGLEIKRELVVGELSTPRKAALPAIAALGGMVVPALIYALFNRHGAGARGFGIPTATDIAFALGCIALVKKRVPNALSVFLVALAIFDDLGAIVVIAIFYGHSLSTTWILFAVAIAVGLALLARFGVRSLPVYLVGFAVLWFAMNRSGIHATIAGVVVGLIVPARGEKAPGEVLDEVQSNIDRIRRAGECDDEDEGNAALRAIEARLEDVQAPSARLQNGLSGLVSFGIMPIFALANAGVSLQGLTWSSLRSPVSLGVMAGLVLGKPIGVFWATWLAVKLRVCPPIPGANLRQMFGVCCLAGVGFTMALFIGGLAFQTDLGLEDRAKVGILLGSTCSALIGLALLRAGRIVSR